MKYCIQMRFGYLYPYKVQIIYLYRVVFKGSKQIREDITSLCLDTIFEHNLVLVSFQFL